MFEKRYGRARWRHRSTSSLRPLMQPPEAPPSALPNVVVIRSTRPRTPKCSGVPRPVFPMKPRGVRVVDEDERAVLLGEGDDLVQLREVAVHREDAVGDDDPEALVGVLEELLLEVPQVGVLVGVGHRLAEAHPVDDRGVDEAVGDEDVLLAEERLEDGGVRVEAGGEEERLLRPEELRQAALELAVDVLRPADEADGRHPVAPLVEARVGGRDHARGARRGRGSCSRRG